MNTISGRGVIYSSQNNPAWKTALDHYDQAVQNAKESIKAMKVPDSQIGYNYETCQFGSSGNFLKVFEFAQSVDEIKRVELLIISSKVHFMMKDIAAKLHQADPNIPQEALARHLIYKAHDPQNFDPQSIVNLFAKIRMGVVKSDMEKAEYQLRKKQPAPSVAAAAVSTSNAVVNDSVEVDDNEKGKAVRAKRDLSAGELVLKGWGKPSNERTKFTIQVDSDAHLEPIEPFVWLNHSCKPNCGLLIGPTSLELYALRSIKRGKEITIDYATFEEHIGSMPPKCLCGSKKCRERIIGYKDLSDEMRKELHNRYGKYMAPYLNSINK